MENKLLIEMGRIKSIMYINENTELLNEGPIDGILSKLITKSIATAEEKLILRFFEKDVTKQITSNVDKAAFSKFIKSAEGQSFIRNAESQISKLTNPNAQRFAQRSLNRMKNAATFWETLGGVSSREGKPFSKFPKPKTESITGPGLENSVETIIKQKPNSGMISSIVRSMNKQDLETILRVYRRIFKTPQALQDEFRRLAESAEYKLKMNPPEHIDYEMKKMADVLIATKKWWKQSPKELYREWISNTDRPIPKRIVAKLSEYGSENKFKELFDELKKNKELYEPIITEWNAYKKLWPLKIPKLLGGKNPGWFIFKKFTPEDQLGKRLSNLLFLKDPRTVEEMKQALMVNGVQQDALRNIVSRVVLEAALLPVYLATVGQVFRPVVSIAETGWNSLPWTEGDSNWIDYNEIKSTNPVKIMKNDWIQCFKSMFPESTWEWIKTVIDPTYLDEFWFNVWVPFITAKGEINEDELKNKAQQFTNKKSQEFKDWYNTLDEKSKKFVNTLISEGGKTIKKVVNKSNELKTQVVDKTTKVVTDIVNSESGFRAWCLKTRRTPREPKPYDPNTELATTNDGKQWYYENGTFNPISK